MTWHTVERVFALIGAFYLALTMGLIVVGVVLSRNADR